MNVTVELKNGTFDLLTSGLVVVNGDYPTTLVLKVDNEQVTLIIKFVNDEKDTKKTTKVAKVLNATTVEITFTNYNNFTGNYTKELWRIASIKNRGLYWGYTIYGFSEGNTKKVDYSFYLGEGVNNG
jgi:hypothetical protein